MSAATYTFKAVDAAGTPEKGEISGMSREAAFLINNWILLFCAFFILFVTMFVYGANGQPTWFVGSNTAYSGGGGTSMSFSGPLYATGGSAYSAPWNPNALNMRQVGTVTFQLTSATTARLTYTVDGAQVTKNVVRQTWKLNDLSGQYIGALAGTFSQCKNAATNGFTLEYAIAVW